MMCYRDKTFCDYYKECHEGKKCPDALTEKVIAEADKWWGKRGAPICQFAEKPECFKEES